MEVLSCSNSHVGDSSCPQQNSGTAFLYGGNPSCIEQCKQEVSNSTHMVGASKLIAEGPRIDRLGGDQGRIDLLCTSEVELPSGNLDGDSHLPESEWPEQDGTEALWVKWRGKWQAGIRCARADCPLSTLKAKPTHDGKKYFVVFFPQTRNHSWAEKLLVCSIHEFPEPIAHRTHYVGVEMVKDLTIPRRFIMQKLAVAMLNITDKLHIEAVIESARKVMAWKEFAMKASRCKVYSDLGRMLLTLQSMILKHFINAHWLQHAFDSWAHCCRNAHSAESVETLMEELVESVLWNRVNALWDAQVQPTMSSEFQTWKQEIKSWLLTTHPVVCGGDAEPQNNEDCTRMGLQNCRKRPKLEVRRAEMHAFEVQARASHGVHHQANTIEIDSEFFNTWGHGNAMTSGSEPCKEGTFTEGPAPTECPGSLADRLDEIVVEAGNPAVVQTAKVEETTVDGGNGRKLLGPGNKYHQCLAFIEAKQRQCGRWANDGDVYCCVHLATRSLGKAAKEEQSPLVNVQMCEGITTHGTKCKHQSRNGSSFCKKHKLQNSQCLRDTENPSSSSENKHKCKQKEKISGSEDAYCKEKILAADQNPIQENEVLYKEGETCNGRNSINKKEHSIKGNNGTELLLCIGAYHQNNNDPCLERATLYSLYCGKHIPGWLKRARNGKSRIISKEVFSDLLGNCSSQEQQLQLHQACELLYGFIKSIQSHINPVPRQAQLQWILFEASKDLCVGEWLMKLVSHEKEKLKRLWGFDANEDKPVSHSCTEQPALIPLADEKGHDIQKTIKCKICAEEFINEQVFGTHWMDAHKKEAQWLYKGYACATCMDSFTNRKVLKTHVRERHGMEFLEECILFQCLPCGNCYVNPEQLWLHVLSAHSVDFQLPSVPQQHGLSAGQASPLKTKLGNNDAMVNSSQSQAGSRKYTCRFCGLKFDLLPDLGRHHQAAHMDSNSINHCPLKREIHLEAYKLNSGRLSRPTFKKRHGEMSYRIRNGGISGTKKHFQTSRSVRTGRIRMQAQANETADLGTLGESQCSAIAKMLFAEIQKTIPRPNNLEILSIARSTCCKVNLQATLEKKYGVLPERLYLKAAKLCSELNSQVEWHRDGFICPKGCKPVIDSHILSPLTSLPIGFVESTSVRSIGPMNSEEWELDECHCIIESRHIKSIPMKKVIVLCEDVSFGREPVPVACVADENLMGSVYNIAEEGSDNQNAGCAMPWESFTYVTECLIDPSLGLDTQSSQLGCACPHSTCHPETCDHVYLFHNDYENAKDINGKAMLGRFPYDKKGRIILEEGYLVYECNSMCSCDKSCQNRVLQNGVQVKLEVFKTENKGWAVRAGEAILRGTFVCEYIGEVLNELEANKRGERYDTEGCSYLYDIDTHINDMSGLTEGAAPYVIDATKYGNVSRFINHSCSPNLVNYQVLVESMDCRLARIGLYASRDIAAGEELAYDYRYKLLPGKGRPCYCGAPNCRGRLY